MSDERKVPQMDDEEIAEAIEHRDALLAIRAILKSQHGFEFFKYLFKYIGILDLPDIGLEGPIVFEQLGKLRAARSVWKLVAEADPEIAGQILARVEKDEYERIYKQANIST